MVNEINIIRPSRLLIGGETKSHVTRETLTTVCIFSNILWFELNIIHSDVMARTLFRIIALCAVNLPVMGGFPAEGRTYMYNFACLFIASLDIILN